MKKLFKTLALVTALTFSGTAMADITVERTSVYDGVNTFVPALIVSSDTDTVTLKPGDVVNGVMLTKSNIVNRNGKAAADWVQFVYGEDAKIVLQPGGASINAGADGIRGTADDGVEGDAGGW